MKWFHINFSDNDLYLQNDQKFVHDFVGLLHKLQHPDKLGLYGLKFRMNEGQAFYVSAPLDHAYKVKEFLAALDVQEVSRPNLKVLKLELGKNGILDQE
jgi:hypothetical protein